MGNIQNIQIIIQPYKTNIKMGKDLNVHTKVQGHFSMVEQYQKHANHNSSCAKCVCITVLQLLGQTDWQDLNLFNPIAFLSVAD